MLTRLVDDMAGFAKGATRDEVKWNDVAERVVRQLAVSDPDTVFVTAAQRWSHPELIRRAEIDGKHVFVIPDALAARLRAADDDTVTTLERFAAEWNDRVVIEPIDPSHLEPHERAVLDLAGDVLAIVGRRRDEWDVVVSETLHLTPDGTETAHGLWEPAQRRIVIHRSCLRSAGAVRGHPAARDRPRRHRRHRPHRRVRRRPHRPARHRRHPRRHPPLTPAASMAIAHRHVGMELRPLGRRPVPARPAAPATASRVYVSTFATVELNASFYRWPSRPHVRRVATTAPGRVRDVGQGAPWAHPRKRCAAPRETNPSLRGPSDRSRLFVRHDGSPHATGPRRTLRASHAVFAPPEGAMAHALRHTYGMDLAMRGVALGHPADGPRRPPHHVDLHRRPRRRPLSGARRRRRTLTRRSWSPGRDTLGVGSPG